MAEQHSSFRSDETPALSHGADAATRPSIFLKLNRTDAVPRELAWREFYDRYAPVIANYARQKGAAAQQADEVVQNVVTGFFAVSPKFVYDPGRGRFRGYLKTCAARALARIKTHREEVSRVPIEEIEIADDNDEELWEKLWREQVLRRAIEIVRKQYEENGKIETFLAFEQNVMFGKSATDVAQQLNMNVGSVHTAKNRVTEKLREVRAKLDNEDD